MQTYVILVVRLSCLKHFKKRDNNWFYAPSFQCTASFISAHFLIGACKYHHKLWFVIGVTGKSDKHLNAVCSYSCTFLFGLTVILMGSAICTRDQTCT